MRIIEECQNLLSLALVSWGMLGDGDDKGYRRSNASLLGTKVGICMDVSTSVGGEMGCSLETQGHITEIRFD